MLLGACQSNPFRINGFAKKLADGDTIVLTKDYEKRGAAADMAVVKDGKFKFSGMADSTLLCMVYLKGKPYVAASFCLEPGTITIELGEHLAASRVSGTKLNNEWQALNDTIIKYVTDITAASSFSYELAHKSDSILKDRLTEFIQRNHDNPLGKMLEESRL